MKIDFQYLFQDVKTPEYATDGSAGFDLVAHNFKKYFDADVESHINPDDRYIYLAPFCRVLVGTGFSVAVPEGYEFNIRPRSGLALKTGLTVLNAPGTIDSDYRGEVGVILYNGTQKAILIKLGERIAQGVIQPFIRADWNVIGVLPDTQRGEGGFGHTGK